MILLPPPHHHHQEGGRRRMEFGYGVEGARLQDDYEHTGCLLLPW